MEDIEDWADLIGKSFEEKARNLIPLVKLFQEVGMTERGQGRGVFCG